MNLNNLTNITSFKIYSGANISKCLQEWILLGSPDNSTWYQLHEQITPYTSRFGTIYPKVNGLTESFYINLQINTGGDILQMVKRFQVARNIADCSMFITSNAVYDVDGNPTYDACGNEIYAPGVTSINNTTGYFIQDNTPFITDSSGTDISGYQFIGGALNSYESQVSNVLNPIITAASTITNTFYNAFASSRTDTYAAVGKMNTTGFDCAAFNTYDTLRTYFTNTPSFTDTIFDSYPYSNAYIVSIQHFAIAGPNLIDVVFTTQSLTSNTGSGSITAGRSVTTGARYQLAVTQGFCDLAATFVSNILPFGPEIRNITNPIFNDYPNKDNILGSGDSINIVNSRALTYKDRLHQTEKMVSGTRTPDATLTAFTPLPTPIVPYDSLTGLRNIVATNLISGEVNTVEYLLNIGNNLPIGKKCYKVQYKSAGEVNKITAMTLGATSFANTLDPVNIDLYKTNFRTYFNSLYSRSQITKIYGSVIINGSILTLSVGIEYTKLDGTVDFTKIPNILEFGNQLYYNVVFKSDNSVLGFEPTTKPNGISEINNSDPLLGSSKNNYINNLLWKNIKFTPITENITLNYSIAQIECYNGTTKQYINSISLSGGNPTNFDLINLIDGKNVQAQNKLNVQYFSHTYTNGDIIANFTNGTLINGFSFMTAYSLQNPQQWIVSGSCDGVNYIQLYNQSSDYTSQLGQDTNGNLQYNSFYRTPILSFTGLANYNLPQPIIRTNVANPTYSIKAIKIRGVTNDMISYQLTNITFFNNNNVVGTVKTSQSDPNDSTQTLEYLFTMSNLTSGDPSNVKVFNYPVNTEFVINFDPDINLGYPNFNGLCFTTGPDVNKCLLKWDIQILNTDGTTDTWLPFLNQTTVYTDDTSLYPHYFCRTPIFYDDGQFNETTQPPIYKIDNWSISKVRLRPIYMYGPQNTNSFELSQVQFFLNNNQVNVTSTTNPDLVNRTITRTTHASDLNIYKGSYLDPATNTILFNFTTPIKFNGFSLMSGSSQFTCIQMWYLDVSYDGTNWITVYSNDTQPYNTDVYPSAYFRTPVIFIDRNINIDSPTKYYVVTGNPSDPANDGILFEVKVSYMFDYDFYIDFVTTDYNTNYYGELFTSNTIFDNTTYLSWANFFNASIISPKTTVNYRNIYPSITGGNTVQSQQLYLIKQNDNTPIYAVFENDDQYGRYYGRNTFISGAHPTTFNLYTNTQSQSGMVFDANMSITPEQIADWTPPTQSSTQGFRNPPNQYIHQFIFTTNKLFDMKFFHLIGINNKPIPKILYTIQKKNDRFFVIYLSAYIEVVGYIIITNLYSKEADSNNWNFYGLKKHDWILLDKQNNLAIPNERSKPLFFYFEKYRNDTKVRTVKALPPVVEEDNEENTPDVTIFKKYYITKINPFSKPVFKMYMYDDSRKIYLVFDEYDMNGRLVGKDLIIGFVIDKHTIKKPIMYQTMDGSYTPFDLSKKHIAFYWKKHIGLDLKFNKF